MARMNGTHGADALVIGGEIIEASALGGSDTVVGSDLGRGQVLVDGSFETTAVTANTWSTRTSVGAWKTDTVIEIWGTGLVGRSASTGTNFIELDSDARVNRIWQDVQTTAGADYEFSFDFASRRSTPFGTNTIEVIWDDVLVGTFDPASTAWRHGNLTLTGTGGVDRLHFREPEGDNNTLGGLIDNATLVKMDGGHAIIMGGSGNDSIFGLGGDDVIYGSTHPAEQRHTVTSRLCSALMLKHALRT